MKIIQIFLGFLLCTFFSSAQITGKILPARPKPISGEMNVYKYQPPKHLTLPSKLYVLLVYNVGNQYHFKKIPLKPMQGKYQFVFKAPDSVEALVIGISGEKNSIIDNNNGLGFISYFYDKNRNIPASARIAATYLLSYYAIQPLQLDYKKLKPVMIKLFQEAYKLSPGLENDDAYTYYLTILYDEKKDAVKNRLLEYAKLMASPTNNENSWEKAIRIYHLLGVEDSVEVLENKAIKIYPNGEIAKTTFLDVFDKSDTTESSILAAIREYVYRFKDTSNQMKYTFYGNLIRQLLVEKKWNEAFSYEIMMPNKIGLAHIYNDFAWQLSDADQFDYSGSNIGIAKVLSKKSLDNISELMNQPSSDDENDGTVQRIYNKVMTTYALILYKLGQYDSAFYYQNSIYQLSNKSDAPAFERLVLYSEKAKGFNFTYHLIEKELVNGVSSAVIINHLQNIAKILGVSDSAFHSLKANAVILAHRNSSEKVRKVFGTQKRKDFALKDIGGQTVSLSSFKNKVIVLVFWATWCIPCRVSFSEMNEIVNNYKNSPDVVFLFIDTWENKSLVKSQEEAKFFLDKNNYDFKVLLDEKNKVAEEYQVNSIPSHLIIDKKGEIVFMGASSNLSIEIESAKELE